MIFKTYHENCFLNAKYNKIMFLFYSAVFVSCENRGFIKAISADFSGEAAIFDDSAARNVRPIKMAYNNDG